MSTSHHPQTQTPPPPTSRSLTTAQRGPVATYNTGTGGQRRLWRQHGRDGTSLVDVAVNGRGRHYLIERALTADEVDAKVADYLAEATEVGDCPKRNSRAARALEATR
jgi:hypothetical protein